MAQPIPALRSVPLPGGLGLLNEMVAHKEVRLREAWTELERSTKVEDIVLAELAVEDINRLRNELDLLKFFRKFGYPQVD